jgi:hypothetical protein
MGADSVLALPPAKSSWWDLGDLHVGKLEMRQLHKARSPKDEGLVKKKLPPDKVRWQRYLSIPKNFNQVKAPHTSSEINFFGYLLNSQDKKIISSGSHLEWGAGCTWQNWIHTGEQACVSNPTNRHQLSTHSQSHWKYKQMSHYDSQECQTLELHC